MLSIDERPIVYLVGAGPGDPDLLTVKADRLLRAADIIVYDRLVAPEILALAPPTARRIFAGKARGHHHLDQDEINATLARLAREGGLVVRLKGGDPFIFGRGGEEADYLLRRGIDIEVVPGITAAGGCSAYAGIPLTRRGFATGVRFVTGHCRKDRPLDLNWSSLADPQTTLVVYMGLANIGQISDRLIAAGMPADMPVAVISNGTTAAEILLVTRLDRLPRATRAASLSPPVLFIIGRVAALARQRPSTAPRLNETIVLPARGYQHV